MPSAFRLEAYFVIYYRHYCRFPRKGYMEHKTIKASAEDGEKQVVLATYPDKCPICSQGVDPRIRFAYLFSFAPRIEAVFQCPLLNCRHLFIGYYSVPHTSHSAVYHLSRVTPLTYKSREFGELISSASSDFVRIFNQAHNAEELGLSDIAGPGYRKALEFLIKDYSISRNADASNDIKNKQLSNVIREHVTDNNIKSTAKRAAWLGNDETHYLRKWEDHDLEDLKILIELTVRWIESELLTRKYEENITD
jgi:hypothetical protein